MHQPPDNRGQLLGILDREGTFQTDQVDRLLEALVFGPEHHWAAKRDRFLNVVDVHPEAATNVNETGILIELGKDTNCVDDQNLGLLFRLHIRIKLTFRKLRLDLCNMRSRNVVRRDDEAIVVGQLGKDIDQQFLVGVWPAAQ